MSRNNTDIQSHSSTPRCPRSEILWSLHGPARPSTNTGQHSVSVNDRQAKLSTGPQIQLASNLHAVNTDSQQAVNSAIRKCRRSRAIPQNPDTIQSTCQTYSISPAVKGGRTQAQKGHERLQSIGTGTGMLPVRPPTTAITSGTIISGSNGGIHTLADYAGRVIQRTLATAYSSLWQAPSGITSVLGSPFCRAIFGCLKQYWSARKSLGICGFGCV